MVSLPPLAGEGAEGGWGQIWNTSKARMTNQLANFDSEQRRAGIRRTVWLVGALALAIFVLFFLKMAVWH